MRRIERESYGFGPSLATKQERLAIAAFVVLFASIIGTVVIGAVLLWT